MKFQSLNESILSVTNPQSKLVEEQKYIEEYIELLEFALEAIAEELECSVEDLLEDIQTPERYAQMGNKLKRSENRVSKADKEVKNAERAENRAYRGKSAIKQSYASSRSIDAQDARQEREIDHEDLARQDSKERKSRKLFGKGGKVVAKTVKEEQDLSEDLPPKSYVDRIKKKTAQLNPEQRAAAMKDRNSGIHRTPAELKKFAASRKAYVKSQNNMTDSKGKKLDPYDDYQS